MKKRRYIVEIEMPDGDFISATWLKDLIQADCDVEDSGRQKVNVYELENTEKWKRKFKVGSVVRKINSSAFDYRLEIVRIEQGYYLADVIGKFSSEVIYFADEDEYELV